MADDDFNDIGDALSVEDERYVDEFGHAAGAALRSAPPLGGSDAIVRRARRHRAVTAGAAVVAVVALASVATVLARSDGDATRPQVTVSDSTQPQTTTSVVSTSTVTTTVPATAIS